MGFWKKLFKRWRRGENASDEWEQIVYRHDDIDFHNEEERTRYLIGCMEQIADAQREITLLTGEYALVTEYLTDMEEIELLPEEQMAEVKGVASKILALGKETKRRREKDERMTESEYIRMQTQEGEVEEGIRKLKEAEKYQKKIKQDLHRLDGERHAYGYRKGELNTMLVNLRGMAVICVVALAACFLMLFILQFGFGMNAAVGYYAATAVAAIAITVLFVKYTDSDKELERVGKLENKLILLQNKVKIRYVNNTNLLDYLYLKYGIDSSKKLQELWDKYKLEKDERREEAEKEAELAFHKEELERMLVRYRVKDPDRWVTQPGALVDHKEMVEIRHGLIIRRQALRKQLEYNREMAESARKEVKDIASEYPMYAPEIAEMAERYEKEYS